MGLTLLFSACILNEQGEDIPQSNFNLQLLVNAENPIRSWRPYPYNKSLVGLKFAFRSTDYVAETDSNMARFNNETNRLPAMAGAYFDLSSKAENLEVFLNSLDSYRTIPYISLDPKDWDEPDIAYQKTFLSLILAGQFDSQLITFAETIKNFSKLVLLRFGHEMNGNWYPYFGGGDANADGKADGPDVFIQTWRYVYQLFENQGVENTLWVFCPAAHDYPAQNWNRPFKYYPGHDYVDLIATDVYEHEENGTQNLRDALGYFYNEMGLFYEEQWAKGDSTIKPFGLGEFGTNRKSVESKAVWYKEALEIIAADARIQFHFLYNEKNGVDDFSITGLGEDIKKAYEKTAFQFQL